MSKNAEKKKEKIQFFNQWYCPKCGKLTMGKWHRSAWAASLINNCSKGCKID
jgi:hypothetical protein